jgi:hypothetical protein
MEKVLVYCTEYPEDGCFYMPKDEAEADTEGITILEELA